MPDEPNKSNKPIVIVAVILLLCAVVGVWLLFRSKTPNHAPVAALRLDGIDETNRVATVSDNGSKDPDGTLKAWRIDWGDGKDESLSSAPQKTPHTYAAEGQYTISLWCVDNAGATSSVPAMTNITFDFLKRQRAAQEMAQAEAKRAEEAKREADRLAAEQAKKEAERVEQEKQKQLAAMQAQKAREQQELEQRRKAEADAEMARKAAEAAKPPPTPLAAGLADNPSSGLVSYTPAGSSLGDFQITKEKTEGKATDGNLLVILTTRCVNFPDTAIPTADWQIDGKLVKLKKGRIRASLSAGKHEVTALFTPQSGLQPKEIKAEVTVETNGECTVVPKK